jgi:hypothetical protein
MGDAALDNEDAAAPKNAVCASGDRPYADAAGEEDYPGCGGGGFGRSGCKTAVGKTASVRGGILAARR